MIIFYRVILVLFFGLLHNPIQAKVVGQIEEINCVSESYTLIREGKNIPVVVLGQLHEGDKIAVNPDKNMLSLSIDYKGKIDIVDKVSFNVPFFPIQKVEVACPLDNYSFVRDNKLLPIQSELRIGDQIIVHKKKQFIRLKLSDGKSVRVNIDNSPYTMKGIEEPSVTNNLLTWVRQTITEWHDEEVTATTISATIRSTDKQTISYPYTNLLKKDKLMKLVAGTRSLFFAWRGGESPYEITVHSENEAIFSLDNIEKQEIITSPLDLVEGSYEIHIKDANEKMVSYPFVVASDKIEYPIELTDINIPESTRLIAQALWLAALAENYEEVWIFESYQQVATLAEQHFAARIVKNALEQRAQIPDLPK